MGLFAILGAFSPWLVGAVRWVAGRVWGVGGDTVAHLDAVARSALDQIGVPALAPINLAPGAVQEAAGSFRAVSSLPDQALRLVLAQTALESSFGHGWGPGCWNMGAEQCGAGGATADYTCVDHGDSHADGTKYTAKYKCFGSQQAAALGYLRLLASDRYADAYAAAENGDALGFVKGLYQHVGSDGKPAGGWFEGTGATDEQRWGHYLAGILARLPSIDAALSGDTAAHATLVATRPPTKPKAKTPPSSGTASSSVPRYAKGANDNPPAPPPDDTADLPADAPVDMHDAVKTYIAQNPGAQYQAQGTPLATSIASAAQDAQGGPPQFSALGGTTPNAPGDAGAGFSATADAPRVAGLSLRRGPSLSLRRRVAGPSDDLRGLLLAAVRDGSVLNADVFVEVEVPALDLVITALRRSLRARVQSYDKALLLGVSYADQIEICRIKRWISPTWEMVDAVWRADFTWRIQPVGQYVPGADRAMQTVAFAAKHTAAVDAAVAALGAPADAVVRPEGKAWIINEALPTSSGAVLWGWQKLDGEPLQGLGTKHDAQWDDYSMCEPPVQRQARILSSGVPIDLLDYYRQAFPGEAMRPFLDAYEV